MPRQEGCNRVDVVVLLDMNGWKVVVETLGGADSCLRRLGLEALDRVEIRLLLGRG
jgi:hypothetical protein